MGIMIEKTIVYLLIIASGVLFWAAMTNATLKRRHSYKSFFVYIALKSLCTNILFQIWLADEMASSDILRKVYICLVTIFAIASYLVMLYIFDESFEKIAVVSSVFDFISAFTASIAQIVADIIGGKAVGQAAPLVWSDFLIPIICGGMVILLLKVGARFWEKIRRWEVKRKNLVMVIFSVYLFFSIGSMQMQYGSGIPILVTTTVFFLAGMTFLKITIDYYYKKASVENDTLKKQQALMKTQYEAVTRQAVKMELAQEEIRKKMQEVSRLSEQTELKSEQIESYIMGLRKQSDEITTGVFCDDWYLDCALCQIMNECKKREIHAAFNLQGYHKDDQSEKRADNLLYILRVLVGDEVKVLDVRISSMKGKTVQKIRYEGELNTKTVKEVERYCNAIDGVAEYSRRKRTIDIVL